MRRQLSEALTMTVNELRPGDDVPWHDPRKARLCVVFRGGLEVEDAAGARCRRPGDLAFRSEPAAYELSVEGARASVLTLEVGPPALRVLARGGLKGGEPVFASSRRAIRLAQLARAQFHRPGSAVELELTGLGCELLATLLGRIEPGARSPEWLARVRARVLAEPAANATLEELGRAENVGPEELSRELRRRYGVSVAQLRLEARLGRAMELLAETDLPLTEVAIEAGFYDQSHLTNALKHRTGLTPRRFRRRARAPSEPREGPGR